ncbi:hypothetical protein CAP35_13060 [Chitinophagaceae bacterium IBVUCB1]|nr:hypothetical protein CAP35_13060 [Chitinophagaceae bacterium IBVUCB1]
MYMLKQLKALFLLFMLMPLLSVGQTWGTAVAVAPPNTTGTEMELGFTAKMLIVNGNPAIISFDSYNNCLVYMRANDASGTSWGSPYIIVGNYPSSTKLVFAIVNGNPAVSYIANSTIYYCRANDANGSTWGTPVALSTNVLGAAILVIANGNPAIAYYSSSPTAIQYIRATDANGSSWGSAVTVVSSPGSTNYMDMQIVNGNPAVAYAPNSTGIKYVRASDASGTSWGSVVTVSSTTTDTEPSLAVVSGNPAIAYNGSSSIKYSYASDANGSTWGSPTTVVSGATYSSHSLAVVNGNPAISYVAGSNLTYVRASNTTGSSWGSAVTITTSSSSSTGTSLVIVNGNPAIAYLNEVSSNFSQGFVRASATDGSTWNSAQTIDMGVADGQYNSITLVNGNPAMSYYNYTSRDLMYNRATTADGSTWGTPVTVAATGDVGTYTSLAVVNGNPAIVYFDSGNDYLYYVRASNANGTAWGTPVLVASGTLTGWGNNKLLVVNGNPAIVYHDGTAKEVKYIRATDANGATWGTPVSLISQSYGTADMAIVDGNPAVLSDASGTVTYIRASDASGTTWGSSVSIGSAGYWGISEQNFSLAVVNGRPAIAYAFGSPMISTLHFIRATNSTGSSWGSTISILTSVGFIADPRLTTIGGYPMIIYSSGTTSNNPSVQYIKATAKDGSVWPGSATSLEPSVVPIAFTSKNHNSIVNTGEYLFLGFTNGRYYAPTVIKADIDNVWSGGNSTTDWFTASNWDSEIVPTANLNVIIPTGLSFYPNIASGTANCKALTVNTGGTLTVSGGTLQATGNISNSGTFNGTGGTLTLNGTQAQTIAAGTLNITNLTLSNSTGATITSGAVNVLGTYTPTSGTLTTGGFLTLKSTATGTGRIAAGSTSGGYITGNVNTERYVPGKRAFRFLSHPFTTAQSMSALTDDIDITGSGGSPFTTTSTNNPSAFYFDVTTGDNSNTGNNPGWTAFTASSNWNQYQAMRVLVRGAKGEGLTIGSYTPSNNTLDMSGTVNQGNQTISLTKGSGTNFVLVGNPFPSQVNMDALTLTNVGSSFFIWDANQGSRGGYTSYTFGSSSFNLPVGGAFATTLSANGSIVIEEADKTNNTAGTMFKTTAIANQVELKLEDSTIYWDRLLLNFDDNAMATVDYPDATKLYNPDMTFYTLSKDDSMLSIDTRPYVASEVIKLGLYAGIKKDFKFTAPNVNMPAGTKLYFTDKLLSKTIEVTPGFEYWFTVDTNAASWGNNRFELNTQGVPTNSIASANVSKLKIKLVPNPTTDNVTLYYEGAGKELNIIVTNMMGMKVATATATNMNGNVTIPAAQLANGIYNVTIYNGHDVITQKLIKQ